MKNLISSVVASLMLASCGLANAADHVLQISPTVQFVYTDVTCTTAVPEEGFEARIVEAYALDVVRSKRADGCAAIFLHPKYGVEAVHFKLSFTDETGVLVNLDQMFPTSRFEVREQF